MKKEIVLTRSEINFNLNGKPHSFIVVHNLTNSFGMSIEDALNNWLSRTKKFTVNSFIKYIMDKDESFVAMTEDTYNSFKS